MATDILIRPMRATDIDDFYQMQQGKNYVAGTLQLPHSSIDFLRKRYENSSKDRHQLVAEIEGKMVGHLSLMAVNRARRKHTGDIGMGVHDDYAGRGVGSALMAACVDMADNWLNIIRIELTVFHDNVAAIALYKKFGFVQEGVLKHYGFRDGTYVDALAMARIRPGFVNDTASD